MPRGPLNVNACSVAGCGEYAGDQPMCDAHWKLVPAIDKCDYFNSMRSSLSAEDPSAARRLARGRLLNAFRGVRFV